MSDSAHPSGDPGLPELETTLYQQLRALAAKQMIRERKGHTLQPAALVHEAILRLAGCEGISRDRGQLLTLAATAMPRALINHARDRKALKRG